MKKFAIILSCAMVLGLATLGNAALQNNGNGLINDTDLNITWYDYTYTGPTGSGTTYEQALTWADGLIVGRTTTYPIGPAWQLETPHRTECACSSWLVYGV